MIISALPVLGPSHSSTGFWTVFFWNILFSISGCCGPLDLNLKISNFAIETDLSQKTSLNELKGSFQMSIPRSLRESECDQGINRIHFRCSGQQVIVLSYPGFRSISWNGSC